MRIRIPRTGEWLASRAQLATTTASRMIGLLSRSSLPPGEVLVFPRCQSVHTWGMRFPIDVILIDRMWKVVAIRPALGPWRIVAPVLGAWAVLEMAAGSAAKAGLAVGDRLELIPEIDEGNGAASARAARPAPPEEPPYPPPQPRIPLLRQLAWPAVIYCLFLLIFSVAYLARWPIMAPDTDLWYHLTSGRYFFEQHRIPSDSFFSFLQPPRPWTDYFWLFQVVVYSVYKSAGYLGLVLFRTALFGLTLAVVLRFLFNGTRPKPTVLGWAAVVFYLFAPFLMPRFLMVRPHMVSYLMIALFLYVLEFRRSWMPLLPVLAILWANLHGIEYPIMLLIVGVYGADVLIRALAGQRDRRTVGQLACLALCAVAVLATPHGLSLLRVPFTPMGLAREYVDELHAVTVFELASGGIMGFVPSSQTCFNVLFFAGLLAVPLALFRRRPRLRHVALWLGGALLLMRGHRFAYECALLSLPLLEASPPAGDEDILIDRLPRRSYLMLAALVMLLPAAYVVNNFLWTPRYPLSLINVPAGNAAFLAHVGARGNILNHPNTGGFWQWAVYPRQRIAMDMEVPTFFTDEDFFHVTQAFSDRQVLGRLLKAYDPVWISVLMAQHKQFKETIAHFPEFVPVFFDDEEVLYVNRAREPELAERYALHGLDPLLLMEKTAEEIVEAERARPPEQAPLLSRLRPLLEIYPDGVIANQVAAALLIDERAYDRALPMAQGLIRAAPDASQGYEQLGDAFKGLKAYAVAHAAYAEAKERMHAAPNRLARKNGQAYFEQGRYREAYAQLKAGVSLVAPKTTLEDLFAFWVSARAVGRAAEAQRILRYIEVRLPEGDTVWTEKIRRELERSTALPAAASGAARAGG